MTRAREVVTRARERLAPPYIGLFVLLLVGVAVRIWAMIAYGPAVLTHHAHDGANYIQAARVALGQGSQEPLGYPLFLRALHAISHRLAFTIGVQHALGLLTAWLLFLTARRLGASRWLALFPAAAALLGGDELFLEHAPLSEALFVPVLAATLYFGVRSLEGGAPWLVGLGVLAVALLAVRSVALPLPLLIIGWVALARWRIHAPVWGAVALAAAASVGAAFAYAAVERNATGNWTVAAAGTGWDLYARAAEFADCRDFTPPKGTAVLCDPTPPAKRQGPGYYHWSGGPAMSAFGSAPAHDGQLRAFAEAAIVHQPLDFLSLAGADLVRYAYPSFDYPRSGGFGGPETLAFPVGTPALDPQTVSEVTAYYGPVPAPKSGAADGLHDYQSVVRLGGATLLLLMIVGVLGMASATGGRRWELALPLMIAAELLIVPTFTGASWRYAVPAEYPLALAAVAAVPVLSPRAAALLNRLSGDRPAAPAEARVGAESPPRDSAL